MMVSEQRPNALRSWMAAIRGIGMADVPFLSMYDVTIIDFAGDGVKGEFSLLLLKNWEDSFFIGEPVLIAAPGSRPRTAGYFSTPEK